MEVLDNMDKQVLKGGDFVRCQHFRAPWLHLFLKWVHWLRVVGCHQWIIILLVMMSKSRMWKIGHVWVCLAQHLLDWDNSWYWSQIIIDVLLMWCIITSYIVMNHVRHVIINLKVLGMYIILRYIVTIIYLLLFDLNRDEDADCQGSIMSMLSGLKKAKIISIGWWFIPMIRIHAFTLTFLLTPTFVCPYIEPYPFIGFKAPSYVTIDKGIRVIAYLVDPMYLCGGSFIIKEFCFVILL